MFCLLLILFLFKAYALRSASDSVCQYDHTKILNDTIVQIFRENNYASRASSIISRATPYYYKYEAENVKKLKPFGSKILMHIQYIDLDGRPQPMYTVFFENETNSHIIYFTKIDCTLHGTAYIIPNNTAVKFWSYFTCINYTLILAPSSTYEAGEKKFRVHASCDAFTSGQLFSHLEKCIKIPYKTQLNLMHAIGILSPSILEDLFVNSEYLMNFPTANLRSPLVNFPMNNSACTADSPKNEQTHYYSISTVSFICLHLNNVKIVGLSNFRSYGHNTTLSSNAHTLASSDIRGSMDASHELLQIPPLGMNFSIDHLYISVDGEANKVWVEARGYSVFQTHSDSVVSISSCLSKYSAIIIEYIASAIGHSIMPSMNVEAVGEPVSSSALREMEKCILQSLKNATIN